MEPCPQCLSPRPAAPSRKPPHGAVSNAQAVGMWVPSSLHGTCSDVVCRGCLVRASWCIYLCARRCVLAWIDECTRCISISSAVFGCIRGCPSMWPVLDMSPSEPVHLWLHPCCIPSCVPAPACAAVALHRWLRAMAPAGCKYWQRGGEVERFMAQGQARES